MMISKSVGTVFAVALMLIFGLVSSPASASDFRVVIDAGHGGSDRGVQLSRNVYEKDVTLAVAKRIETLLARESSIEAVLTRSEDREVSLDGRRNAIRSANADLLISLQVNAGFGMRASGYEIYFSGFHSSARKDPGARDVIDTMLETTYTNNSIRFSNIMDRELGRVFPREGRGVRGAPMAILREISMPGVLVEMGFASNVRNRDALLDESVQNSISESIVRSIKEYFAVVESES